MGFFSWRTLDTNKSIANAYSSRPTFRVYMTDNKGNHWVEDNYEGYGEFGGKDYYELLAEMNGIKSDLQGEDYTKFMRGRGIDLAFEGNGSGIGTKGVKYPNLVENIDTHTYYEQGNDNCRKQGFFYKNN